MNFPEHIARGGKVSFHLSTAAQTPQQPDARRVIRLRAISADILLFPAASARQLGGNELERAATLRESAVNNHRETKATRLFSTLIDL